MAEGRCSRCGAENVQVNEEGVCLACAGAPQTAGHEAGSAPAENEPVQESTESEEASDEPEPSQDPAA